MEPRKIITELESKWNQYYKSDFEKSGFQIKTFSKENNNFVLYFFPNRLNYRPDNGNGCMLCNTIEPENKIVNGQFLKYAVNIFPYFEKHIVAFSKEHTGLASGDQLRELFDILQITNHAFFLNLVGAGASINDHIHYQGIIADFPIDKKKGKIVCESKENDFAIERIEWPAYILRFSWNSPAGMEKTITTLITYHESEKPFNLILFKDRIYFIPRSNVYSEIVPNWKIAAAEVGGLFVTKFEEVFKNMNYEKLEKILLDTTITCSKEQNAIEEKIRTGI